MGITLLAAMETVLAGKDPGIDLSKHLTPEELAEVEAARKNMIPKEPTFEEKKEMKPYIPELSIEHKRKILKQEYPDASDSDIQKLRSRTFHPQSPQIDLYTPEIRISAEFNGRSLPEDLQTGVSGSYRRSD